MGCLQSKSKQNLQQSKTETRQQQQQSAYQNEEGEEVVQGASKKQQQQAVSSKPGLLQQAKDAKQNYDNNQKIKWINEVYIEETDLFKENQQWFDLYEPKSQSNQQNKGSSQPGSAQAIEKMLKKNMVQKLEKTITDTILEQFSTIIQFVSQQVKPQEPLLYSFLNSFVAILLTYRFQYLNNDKFYYIQDKATDRFAETFILFLDNENKKLGQTGVFIDYEQSEKIIDNLVQLLLNHINQEKQKIFEKVKQNSLFQMSGEQGQKANEGVTEAIDAIQAFGEQKLLGIVEIMKKQLPNLLLQISRCQDDIRAQIAQKAKEEGLKEPSDEYIKNVRSVISDIMEKHYTTLTTKINQFTTQLVDMIFMMSQEEHPEDYEEY